MVVDWDSITHLFQLPLRWFREIDRRSWLITDGVTLEVDRNRPEGTELRINKSGLGIPDKDVGTAEDKTDQEVDDDTDGDTWVWESGGENGLMFDCYCKTKEDGNWHYLSRARLTYSKDGLLVRAEGLAGRREIEG